MLVFLFKPACWFFRILVSDACYLVPTCATREPLFLLSAKICWNWLFADPESQWHAEIRVWLPSRCPTWRHSPSSKTEL